MESNSIIELQLSDNGELPTMYDIIESSPGSWHKNLKSTCIEMGKNGIFTGVYKSIDVNLHTDIADEVEYHDETIETEIHIGNINFIFNNDGKLLVTIETDEGFIDFICDFIVRLEECSLFFKNPVLTEYELLWPKEQKLKFERENKIFKYFMSKSIVFRNDPYNNSFLPLNCVNIKRIEPYNAKENLEYVTMAISLTLWVNKLEKSIWARSDKGYHKGFSSEIFFRSISHLNSFLKGLQSGGKFELQIIEDSIDRSLYLLKRKDNKAICNEDLQYLGFKLMREKVESDPYDDYDFDSRKESWYAMTDGQYGDMPDGFDGDYDFLGF